MLEHHIPALPPTETKVSIYSLWKRLRSWLELFLAACILLAIFCTGVGAVEFHEDESDWIATSSAFEVFTSRAFASPVWQSNYWTLTQPPAARYVIALGRLAGGYQVEDLNEPWHEISDSSTQLGAAMPDAGLLWWSRLPMALLAVVSALLLFRLVSAVAGKMGANAFLCLFAASSYFALHLRRAESESPVLVFLVSAIVATYIALESLRRGRSDDTKAETLPLRPFGWLCIAGIFCGIATAAKLNAVFSIPAALLLCILASVTQNNWSRNMRISFVIRSCTLVLLISASVFVALNPYLYPDVPLRMVNLFAQRVFEMRVQQVVYADQAIRDISTRLSIVPRRVFQDYAAMSFPRSWLLNAPLSLIGLWQLFRGSWSWLRKGTGSSAAIVIIVFAVTLATPSLMTPLDWDRYYLFPVVFATLCIAIGVASVIKWLREIVVRLLQAIVRQGRLRA